MTETDRNARQVRSICGEFKTRDDGEPVIEGYFAVFNSDYVLWPGATERVAPGAFSDELDKDVRALADHDTRIVLGRTTAGTLTLEERERGLWGSIRVNRDDSEAMNLFARVKRGDVNQCSFGFTILDEEFIENPDGSVMWIIKKVNLYEVSVVTFPAYTETSVDARKADFDNFNARKVTLWQNKMKERVRNVTQNVDP